MSRYIKADAIENTIKKRVYAIEVEDILAELGNAPSIDIVRCKECKYVCHYVDDGHMECRLLANGRPAPMCYQRVTADDFCSYGERKDEPYEYEIKALHKDHVEPYVKVEDEPQTDCAWR